jgi:hypothetical protein
VSRCKALLGCVLLAGVCACDRARNGQPEPVVGPGDVLPAEPDSAREPAAPPDKRGAEREQRVTVVCEVLYYAEGCMGDKGFKGIRLNSEADPKREWYIDGFVLTVVSPVKLEGQILCMHHDGVLASGNPYEVFTKGRRYEINVPKSSLGQFTFVLCSIDGPRKPVEK